MHTPRGDGVAGIKRCRRNLSGDGVKKMTMASGHGRLKEDLKSSTWRRQEDPEEDPDDYPADGGDDEEEERISIRPHSPLSPSTEAPITEYASAPTPLSPPPSPLSPLSPLLPRIPSPSLLLPPPHTSPTYASAPLGYRVVMVDMPSRKRLCLTAPASRFKVWESLIAAATRQTGHTLAQEVNERVTDLATTQRQDAYELYAWSRLEDRSTDLEALIRAHDARTTTLEAHVGTLRTQHDRIECQGVADALAEYEATRNSRNGDDSHDSRTGRRTERVTRECTYSDFLKCQPLNFKGTKGVIGLTQCALTWWNSHVKIVGHDDAYGMTWKTLKKMMTDRRMFPEESDEVEKYVGGLPDMIQGSVMASKPKTMQDAIEFTTDLMDQKICTFAKRQAENKRKLDDNSRNNHTQQQPHKRQNVARAYTDGPGENHLAHDCRSPTATVNNQRAPRVNQRVVTCFECGVQGHYKKDSPKLKNNNRGNLAGNSGAPARAYAVGNAWKNSNSNDVTGTFLLNNHYASILFDTGADRSFMSTTCSSLIDIVPTTLDHDYDVELADGKIIRVNTIIRGYTLNFLNHLFNIDLMPIELGSFDVIIGMDWLSMYHAVIVCDEKIVRIPFGNEILIVRGDESNNGYESRLNIISCTKTQKYLLKGCHVFLAHVTTKKAEDKSGEKRLKDVPIIQDFPKVFPEDLSGIPPTQQLEFQIDLIPGAAPVTRAPYLLASSEIKELSDQLQELSNKGFL
ncbi:putative reverse transcriptase domain-containing protein [Tanacetum coccineum]|uniref:Reverse transcriptase domain-containing protein n=1 Tax=Tanacetum coccineum TaxID=301880 RepID=A0ABQ4Z5Z3_9ASTR